MKITNGAVFELMTYADDTDFLSLPMECIRNFDLMEELKLAIGRLRMTSVSRAEKLGSDIMMITLCDHLKESGLVQILMSEHVVDTYVYYAGEFTLMSGDDDYE